MRMNLKTIYESIVSKGKHWPEDYIKTGYNTIKASPLGKTSWYSDNYINQDLKTIANEFGPLSHKNSNLGYFSPIIRWFVEYSGSDPKKYQEFIETKLDGIVQTLLYLSNNPSEEIKVKDDLKTKWKFKDFEKFQKEIQNRIDAQQRKKSGNLILKDKGYEVIPIMSYEELHEKFGGNKTGYKGESEWCHTNGSSTYNSWTGNGKYMFFVLAKKGWEKIDPPDPKTTTAYDDYGTSLIAILVLIETNSLEKATLRWNHIIEPSKTVPGTSVDKAFLGWADLDEMVGIRVENEVEKITKDKVSEIRRNQEEANEEVANVLKDVRSKINIFTFSNEIRQKMTKYATTVNIPEGVVIIGNNTFEKSESLRSVTIPNSVTKIGSKAFHNCESLSSVNIPESVSSIGEYAFFNTGIKELTIPSSIEMIEEYSFGANHKLERVILKDGVKTIGGGAFIGCDQLESIEIPNGLEKIDENAFMFCKSLKEIRLPDSLKYVGPYAFSKCESLVIEISKNFNKKALKDSMLEFSSYIQIRVLD